MSDIAGTLLKEILDYNNNQHAVLDSRIRQLEELMKRLQVTMQTLSQQISNVIQKDKAGG